jgi:hypothetical protein
MPHTKEEPNRISKENFLVNNMEVKIKISKNSEYSEHNK